MSNDVAHFILHLYLELYNNSVPMGISDCVNECERTKFIERVSCFYIVALCVCLFMFFYAWIFEGKNEPKKYMFLYFIMSLILSY